MIIAMKSKFSALFFMPRNKLSNMLLNGWGKGLWKGGTGAVA